MNIKDEVYPKVKADVRMTDDKTLWVKVSKPEFEKIGRIILEDGSVFCKVFYQDAEPERKTGHWIKNEKQFPICNDYRYECSECGFSDIHNETVEVPYCWNCGAKMEGESE